MRNLFLFLGALLLCPMASFSQSDAVLKEAKSVVEALEKPTQIAGRTDFSVADRMAIENIMASYTFGVDEYHYDAYFDLFWPDAVFLVTEPNNGTAELPIAKMRPAHIGLFNTFKAEGLQRRHMMTSTLFLHQDPTRIRIVAESLMVDSNRKKNVATLVTPIVYEGWFEKRGNVWKIIRWHGNLDVTSNAPDAKPEETLGYWLKQTDSEKK